MRTLGWPIAAGIAALFVSGAARAETYDIREGDDLFGRLTDLAPGDEVVVHAGTYVTPGFFEVVWPGTADAPILVRAADGDRPIIQGDPSQNVINVTGSHFVLRGFEITGGSHGIRLGSSDHGTLEDLLIHDIGDVGISCNRPGETCDSMTFRGNEIHSTGLADNGEGMYLGCNDSECTFSNSVVDRNYIHDLGGSQGDGIEIKTGSFGNVVRDNVIVRSNYPAITMYGFAPGLGERNVVEGNLVWGTVDNGIQVVGQVIVRNNVIIDAGTNGIQSKASQGFAPTDLVIVHNTVIGAGDVCMKTNDWAGAGGERIVGNNAFYCAGGTAIDFNGGNGGATVAGNVVLGDHPGDSGVADGAGEAADLGAPPTLLYPPAGSALVDAGDPVHATTVDFNGTPRADALPDVGAYERTADTNPGWMIAEGFKAGATPPTPPPPPPPGDGGITPPAPPPSGDAATTPPPPRADGGARTDTGPLGRGDDSGGCGCAIVGSRSSAHPFGLPIGFLLLVAALVRSRRSNRGRA